MKHLIKIIILTAFVFMGCDNGNAQQKANQIKKNRPKTVQKRVQKNSNQALIAPDFTLADLDGNWVSLSELKGKVVLLNFWGTWCGPCRREIPAFIKLTEKYKKDGLEIVGITLTSGLFLINGASIILFLLISKEMKHRLLPLNMAKQQGNGSQEYPPLLLLIEKGTFASVM